MCGEFSVVSTECGEIACFFWRKTVNFVCVHFHRPSPSPSNSSRVVQSVRPELPHPPPFAQQLTSTFLGIVSIDTLATEPLYRIIARTSEGIRTMCCLRATPPCECSTLAKKRPRRPAKEAPSEAKVLRLCTSLMDGYCYCHCARFILIYAGLHRRFIRTYLEPEEPGCLLRLQPIQAKGQQQ